MADRFVPCAGRLLRTAWPPLRPHSRPITAAAVFRLLMLGAAADPLAVAHALTLRPGVRHVRRAAACLRGLVRRGLAPEEVAHAAD